MLQQTTVEVVVPYYHRFLKKFPNVRRLAAAPEDEVLRVWSGLGYYARARNLRRAAEIVVKDFGGRLPESAEELEKLPGIGRYTAGAIASIAFNRRAPILDGNVARVLARLFLLKSDPKSPTGQKLFWKKAQEILPPEGNYSDFNQALMELGATVCLPQSPICSRCPLAVVCRARTVGDVESYPRLGEKTVPRRVILSAALIEERGRLLMTRRPDSGLLRGLWEFPMVEGEEAALVRRFGVQPIRALPPVRHSVLDRRLTITPFVCDPPMTAKGWPLRDARGGLLLASRWVRPIDFGRLPTSSMNRKVLATFLAQSR